MIAAIGIAAVVTFFLSVHAAYGFGQTGQRSYLEMAIVAGAVFVVLMGCIVGLAAQPKKTHTVE